MRQLIVVTILILCDCVTTDGILGSSVYENVARKKYSSIKIRDHLCANLNSLKTPLPLLPNVKYNFDDVWVPLINMSSFNWVLYGSIDSIRVEVLCVTDVYMECITNRMRIAGTSMYQCIDALFKLCRFESLFERLIPKTSYTQITCATLDNTFNCGVDLRPYVTRYTNQKLSSLGIKLRISKSHIDAYLLQLNSYNTNVTVRDNVSYILGIPYELCNTAVLFEEFSGYNIKGVVYKLFVCDRVAATYIFYSNDVLFIDIHVSRLHDSLRCQGDCGVIPVELDTMFEHLTYCIKEFNSRVYTTNTLVGDNNVKTVTIQHRIEQLLDIYCNYKNIPMCSKMRSKVDATIPKHALNYFTGSNMFTVNPSIFKQYNCLSLSQCLEKLFIYTRTTLIDETSYMLKIFESLSFSFSLENLDLNPSIKKCNSRSITINKPHGAYSAVSRLPYLSYNEHIRLIQVFLNYHEELLSLVYDGGNICLLEIYTEPGTVKLALSYYLHFGFNLCKKIKSCSKDINVYYAYLKDVSNFINKIKAVYVQANTVQYNLTSYIAQLYNVVRLYEDDQGETVIGLYNITELNYSIMMYRFDGICDSMINLMMLNSYGGGVVIDQLPPFAKTAIVLCTRFRYRLPL